MTSIYTKIMTGEVYEPLIYEDDICVVMVDKFPLSKGMSLVVPRQESPYLFDKERVDVSTYIHLMLVARSVAEATDKAYKPKRTTMLVSGFEVPDHIHVKVIPSYSLCYGEVLMSEKDTLTIEQQEKVAKKLKQYMKWYLLNPRLWLSYMKWYLLNR